MNKIFKIGIVCVIFCFLILWGHNKYLLTKRDANITYHTSHKTKNSAMLIGGMASDKDKVDIFRDGLEEKDFRKYWDLLHEASAYSKEGNYGEAIRKNKEALNYAKSRGDIFQVYWGLARLYEKSGEYELALRILDKVPEVNDRKDVQQEAEEWKKRLQLQKEKGSGLDS